MSASNRDYNDQLYIFIGAQAQKLKLNGEFITEEFFRSDDLRLQARKGIDTISAAFSWSILSEEDFKQCYGIAISEYKTNHPIDIIASASLKQKARGETWLTDERYNVMPKDYTDRYFRYLRKTGRAEKVLEETYKSSLRILEKLGDPDSKEQFYIKGLVVGSVQSGKTTNFNAVINRAIDSGYELIIVLSGIMEDLRKQTQLRIEKEVAGYGVVDEVTEKKDFKGVGEIKKFGVQGDKTVHVHQVVLPTSHKVDFKKTLKEADFSLNNKNVLVCKKNPGVLKNLILWLDDYLHKSRDKHDIPFLIIDDEADNASLNNLGSEGKEFASKINGHIRALLGLFNKKSYLGYTATPFANVLQDRNEVPGKKWPITYKEKGESVTKEFDLVDNLFPEHFIELLFPPSNYIGAKHFFETRIEEITKIEPLIPPCADDAIIAFPSKIEKENGKLRATTKDDEYPQYLPDSLKDAVQCFILSTAVRLSRKSAMRDSKLYNPHNSMLIHISRFTNWQTRTKILVVDYMNIITAKLNTELPNDPKSIYAEFERTWFKYYAHVIENIRTYLPDDYEDPFLIPKIFEKDIKPLLIEAVRGIEVKAINSQTGDNLTYPEKGEKKYIAIGGNRLSRGFTLEGLTINYFIRNTDYADTLLQMGRWFGYRPGYLDCCKLFTTSDSVNKFDAITSTIEELEEIFKVMSKSNAEPKEFDVRVRTHPRVLKITRASIMKNTEAIKVNYSGDIEQSTKFDISKARIEKAWDAFTALCGNTKWTVDEGYFILKTDSDGLFKFLDLENSFYDFDLPGVKEYIRLCNIEGKLINWTIAIKRNFGSRPKVNLAKGLSLLPEDMNLTIRRGPKKEKEENARSMLFNQNIFKASGRSANIVASGEDFAITLDKTRYDKAIDLFQKRKAEEIAKKEGISKAEALIKAKKINSIPDKEFRAQMEEKDGVLVIYLIDSKRIFEPVEGILDTDLLNYVEKKQLNLEIPLIGYALGFPRVSGEIGGTYVHYKEDIEEEDEFDESLFEEEN